MGLCFGASYARLRQWVVRKMASPRIGVILMIHLTALLIVAAFTPARETPGFTRSSERFALVEEIPEPTFLSFQSRVESAAATLLLVSLGVSLTFSLYVRVRSEFKRSRHEKGRRPQEDLQERTVLVMRRELERRGYRVGWNIDEHGSTLIAQKGGIGVWGSLLLHASLLVLLLGMLLSRFASFEGAIALTEGQTFDTRTDHYGLEETGQYYAKPSSDFSLRLVRVDPWYEVNRAHTVAAIIKATKDGATLEVPVYINNGVTLAGRTIHLGAKTGYSPFVRLVDSAGVVALEGYLRLATISLAGHERYRDYINVAGGSIRAEFELYPDGVASTAEYATAKGPTMRVQFFRDGLSLADVLLAAGTSRPAGGYMVSFGNVRRWSQLDISDDRGLPVLMVGSILASLGLAIRLMYVRKRVIVGLLRSGDSALPDIHGVAEKFQKTFEEEIFSIRLSLARIAREKPGSDDHRAGHAERTVNAQGEESTRLAELEGS